ncbi:MAG TPA: hypothetical protein VIT43_06505 [Candidatus Dormibacteraeota bacterium]
MQDHTQPNEPITYVGGLGEPPKRHVWPFFLLGIVPVVLAVSAVLLWNPIRSLGRSAGNTIAPYSLTLDSGGWSSDQKIATVPITLSLTLSDADTRTVDGITLRFTKLNSAWEIVGASSGDTAGTVNGNVVFFPTVIAPHDSATLAVTLRPSKAMKSEIDLTLTPGRSKTPAKVQLADGSVTTTLSASGNVRDPMESDADARLTAFYDPQPNSGALTIWQIHVANTGPITINGIKLRFPQVPPGLELGVGTDATVLPDGQTVQFQTSLEPGGQTVLNVGVTPHLPGHFLIPVLVYLGSSTQSLSSANGGAPLSIDVTVS